MKSFKPVAAATVAAALLAAGAEASIPPPAWQAPTWSGPARVCGEAFAFDLASGEEAVQTYPSTGKIRYGLTTAKGRVVVAELWNTGPPEVAPESEDRPGGRLHPLAEKAGEPVGYLFLPTAEKGLPVEVHFHGDAWTPKDFDGVLKRLDFGREPRDACTEPVRKAG